MLAKCLGVKHLIVVVNKMDEDNWSKKRFDNIKDLVSDFLDH
jgi:translation elongation factor EF-1alpha